MLIGFVFSPESSLAQLLLSLRSLSLSDVEKGRPEAPTASRDPAGGETEEEEEEEDGSRSRWRA